MRAFTTNRLPGREDKFLTVEKPTLLEKVGDNWKITEQGAWATVPPSRSSGCRYLARCLHRLPSKLN